jgi:CheY-like chemotaxis protein
MVEVVLLCYNGRPMSSGLDTPTTQTAILSVDDNDAMLFARSTVLRNAGYSVIEARSGREALKALETAQPTLALLDVNLPDMSGFDLARRIRANPVHRGMKIVQISATFVTPHDQLSGLDAGGADIYLTEPVPRETLVSVIRRLIKS